MAVDALAGHRCFGGVLVAALRNPERLETACSAAGIKLTLRRQAGYEHLHFLVASFVADHLDWHSAGLRQ